MKTKIYFMLLSVFLCVPAVTQTNDFGIWTSLEVEKDMGKWDLGLKSELRTFNNTSELQRFSIRLNVGYKIAKPLKVGAIYKYIYYNDLKYSDYQPRIRYAFFIQGKLKAGDFSFYLREKLCRTIKDESDRIIESGNYDNYKINPEWTLRSRLKVKYNIPNFKGTPAFSIEPFYQLNNPDGNTFENIRYTLSFDYKLSKHHKLRVYGLIDDEMHVNDPVRTFVLGFGYKFSF